MSFFIIKMHIDRVLIKAKENSPKAFKIGKTPELPGVLTPAWALPQDPTRKINTSDKGQGYLTPQNLYLSPLTPIK